MKKKKTTDLEAIKAAFERYGAGSHGLRNFPYTWGEINDVLTIGRYTVLVYNARKMNSEEVTDDVYFGVYVDGEDCPIHTKTLEGALLIGMDVAVNGKTSAMNRNAAHFAAKVLGINV